jgi:uncharacterized protein YigE (DUF2233 family)
MALDDGKAALRGFERLQAHLGPRARALRFGLNAGMFDENGRPIGLDVESGRQRHALSRASGGGNFGMQPNGLFSVADDGRVAVATTESWAARPRPAHWASQSGPMLVIAGRLHPRLQANGPSLNIRNGVGVDGPGTAWFAISDDPVSFGRFARFFRDVLGCRDALYLDGAVSSRWDRPADRMDRRAELGPLILVFGRGG